MVSTVWTSSYDINTMVLNPQKRLGLVGLLNILQDVAWIHGSHLGHGYEAMMRHGSIWVLARQQVVMSAWPAWGERIDIRTWVRPPAGMLVLRDSEIMAGDRKLGEATAGWLILDATSRRPVRPHFSDTPVVTRAEGGLALNPGRIAVRDSLQPGARFQVRNSDLDVNGHVNNTRYAQWILDAVPLSAHRAWRVAAYEVNFLAETTVGDCVTIEWGAVEGGSAPGRTLQFQGRREGDGKVVFAARLGVVAMDAEGGAA
jgi:acyl-ACP thioesterase